MSAPFALSRKGCVSVVSAFGIAAGVHLLVCAPVQAGTLRTQQIQLQKGWNSVFLEVFPVVTATEVVFSNALVIIVAAHFPLPNCVEFVTNPSRINWKKEGWGVWYAPGREDAF